MITDRRNFIKKMTVAAAGLGLMYRNSFGATGYVTNNHYLCYSNFNS
jgi:hypothetical protein